MDLDIITSLQFQRYQTSYPTTTRSLEQPSKGTTIPNHVNEGNDAPLFRTLLGALSHVVSRLEPQHSSLTQAIIDIPWTTMDNSFVSAYTQFIGVLVSAKPEYLSLILNRIAVGFTHRPSFLFTLD